MTIQRNLSEMVLGKLLELEPLSSGIQTDAGWLYFNAGQLDRSMAAVQKALELDPKSFYPHFVLGWDFREIGKMAEAVSSGLFEGWRDEEERLERDVLSRELYMQGFPTL